MMSNEKLRKTLRTLYWDKNLSLEETANKIGVSDSTIYRWMKKYGIPRRSISEAKEGHSVSEEARKKMSEAHMGLTPWNKGKTTGPLSIEHRKKISEAHKGQVPWNTGIHLSEETRRKISEANKGQPPWNKGLTKETDERVKKQGESLKASGKSAGKNHPFYGKHLSEETRRKLSESMSGENHPFYGKHRSEEAKRKIRESLLGKNSPNWRGGTSFKPYPPEFNIRLKRRIRKRDNYTCQLCGIKQNDLDRALSIHHIDYDKNNNSPENLVALCVFCHNKTNDNRKKWEAYFKTLMEGR